jgi:hypothetical protein
MKDKIKEVFKDEYILKSSIANVFIFILFVIVLIIKWNHLEIQLPLFYSLPRGEEQLGNPISILILPASSFFLFFINFFISLRLFNQEKLCVYLLFSSSLILSLLLFITFLKIVFLIS